MRSAASISVLRSPSCARTSDDGCPPQKVRQRHPGVVEGVTRLLGQSRQVGRGRATFTEVVPSPLQRCAHATCVVVHGRTVMVAPRQVSALTRLISCHAAAHGTRGCGAPRPVVRCTRWVAGCLVVAFVYVTWQAIQGPIDWDAEGADFPWPLLVRPPASPHRRPMRTQSYVRCNGSRWQP